MTPPPTTESFTDSPLGDYDHEDDHDDDDMYDEDDHEDEYDDEDDEVCCSLYLVPSQTSHLKM